MCTAFRRDSSLSVRVLGSNSVQPVVWQIISVLFKPSGPETNCKIRKAKIYICCISSFRVQLCIPAPQFSSIWHMRQIDIEMEPKWPQGIEFSLGYSLEDVLSLQVSTKCTPELRVPKSTGFLWTLRLCSRECGLRLLQTWIGFLACMHRFTLGVD